VSAYIIFISIFLNVVIILSISSFASLNEFIFTLQSFITSINFAYSCNYSAFLLNCSRNVFISYYVCFAFYFNMSYKYSFRYVNAYCTNGYKFVFIYFDTVYTIP